MKKIVFIFLAMMAVGISCEEQDFPYPRYIKFDNTDIIVERSAGTIEIPVNSDISTGQLAVRVPEEYQDWILDCTLNGYTLTVSFAENSDDLRNGYVEVYSEYRSATVNLYQKGNVNPEFVELRNSGWQASASDVQSNDGGGVMMIFNADHTKYWHSSYSPYPDPLMPHWILVDMLNPKRLSKIELGWRQYGSNYYKNTRLTEIWVSLTDEDDKYEKVGEIDCGPLDGTSIARPTYPATNSLVLDQVVEARFVKLMITKSNHANGVCNMARFIPYMSLND